MSCLKRFIGAFALTFWHRLTGHDIRYNQILAQKCQYTSVPTSQMEGTRAPHPDLNGDSPTRHESLPVATSLRTWRHNSARAPPRNPGPRVAMNGGDCLCRVFSRWGLGLSLGRHFFSLPCLLHPAKGCGSRYKLTHASDRAHVARVGTDYLAGCSARF